VPPVSRIPPRSPGPARIGPPAWPAARPRSPGPGGPSGGIRRWGSPPPPPGRDRRSRAGRRLRPRSARRSRVLGPRSAVRRGWSRRRKSGPRFAWLSQHCSVVEPHRSGTMAPPAVSRRAVPNPYAPPDPSAPPPPQRRPEDYPRPDQQPHQGQGRQPGQDDGRREGGSGPQEPRRGRRTPSPEEALAAGRSVLKFGAVLLVALLAMQWPVPWQVVSPVAGAGAVYLGIRALMTYRR